MQPLLYGIFYFHFLQEKVNKFIEIKRKKYTKLKIELETIKMETTQILDHKESLKFIDSIIKFKHGVFNTNNRNEVTTSINLGVVNLEEQTIKIGMRSSKKCEEIECLEHIKEYAKSKNLEFNILGSQPGFETNEKSELIKKNKKSIQNNRQTRKTRYKITTYYSRSRIF